MRHLYLAATGQNRGKTTVSLGVMDGFTRRGLSTGFCKPCSVACTAPRSKQIPTAR